MRGRSTSRRALAVTAVILLGAALFAFLRSRDQADWPAQSTPEEHPASEPSPIDWQTLGMETYQRNCQACHAAQGRGRDGLAPSLVPLTLQIHQAEGGSEYLIQFLLWGLEGEVVIENESYQDHPPFHHLSDAQHSALLNLLTYAWPDEARHPLSTPAFTPQQIAAHRQSQLTPKEVHQSRLRLELGERP